MKINKETLPTILNRLGKETRKAFRDTPVDIWVVGGANLVYSFDFRDATMDIDVIKNRAIDLRDIALKLEGELDLPHNWINDSVMFSASFSMNLRKYATSVRQFNHSLVCHFVDPVAIVCMKIRANRVERSDLSDAICAYFSAKLTIADVEDVYFDLYNSQPPEWFAQTVSALSSYLERIEETTRCTEVKRLNELSVRTGTSIVDLLQDLWGEYNV